MEIGLSLVYAIGFTLIHLFSKSMAFIKDRPRSRFLSIYCMEEFNIDLCVTNGEESLNNI